MMHLRKGRKSLFYFFLFIILGSINNLSLDNIKFDNIKNIKVTGLDIIENSIIIEEIKALKLKNIYFINPDKINQTIVSNTLVEKYYVHKTYPSSLDIQIIKTNFLAKIKHKDKIFLIGSNGKLTKNIFNDKHLPFIFGKPKIKEFLYLKKIIDQSRFRYDQIINFYFFPSSRWDLELKDNIVLKLPKENIRENLDHIFKLLNDPNFKNIKTVDARIKNQIILND